MREFSILVFRGREHRRFEGIKFDGINRIVAITIKKPVQIYKFSSFGGYSFLRIFQNYCDMEDG